jgi:hypothetical protein
MPESTLMSRQTALLSVCSLVIAAMTTPATPAETGRGGDMTALADERELLESRRDPQIRAWMLNELSRMDRPQWSAIAPQIGLKAEELDWLLAVRAQRHLVNDQREAQCEADPACNPAAVPGWRDPFDDLSSQLGKERLELYQLFITARDERAYLSGLQRRMAASDPLPDSTIEQLAQALIAGRTQIAREARQLGFTVQVHLLEEPTVHLWSAYTSRDDWNQRRDSAARYARWLQDVAARYLSAAQLADFKAMIERETAAHDAWIPTAAFQRADVKAAIAFITNKNVARPPDKSPEGMARARFNLTDQRYQTQAQARFIRNAGTYWTERAATTLLKLSPRELEQMAKALGELEFRQELQVLACITDPDCHEDIMRTAHREARSMEAARIMGPAEFAHFSRANGADSQIYYNMREFLDELPDGHKLADAKARRLAEALAAEEAGNPKSARPDETRTARAASAKARVQRFHDIAGKFLDREQLRLFDAMQRRENGIATEEP